MMDNIDNNSKNENINYEINSDMENIKLTHLLEENINMFKRIFKDDQTLVTRRFANRSLKAAKCCIIYFDGMINHEIINDNIIKPVLRSNLNVDISERELLEELQYKVIVSDNVEVEGNVEKIIKSVLYGDTIFLIDGYEKVLVISTKGWQTRSIIEPESAKVVRGPREGFNEAIMTNIALIRRRIQNPNFKVKFRKIGEITSTRIGICYIDGLVLESILTELEKRLDEIDIDGILDSGYIQELIRDASFSPFETVGYTERPDVVAGRLLEGRIAVIADGSPFVLTVPYILAESIQSNEDYYNNYIFSSINRLLRSAAMIFSVSIPALYLSLTTFHQEMIPTPLLISISAARKDVPFPIVISLIFMLLAFDVLREAGTRMPTSIGQAVSIVGTLVLGQAAVDARLVSAPVVIITAMTGILTLMNISMIGAIIIVRFLLLILSSFIGVYGYIFGVILVILHLTSIRSFGVPYMLSMASIKNKNAQDIWIRLPWWEMKLRPKIIGARNLIRQNTKKTRR